MKNKQPTSASIIGLRSSRETINGYNISGRFMPSERFYQKRYIFEEEVPQVKDEEEEGIY